MSPGSAVAAFLRHLAVGLPHRRRHPAPPAGAWTWAARNDFTTRFTDARRRAAKRRFPPAPMPRSERFERLVVPSSPCSLLLIPGPGAISTVVIYAGEARPYGVAGFGAGLGVIAAVSALIVPFFWTTSLISRLLGRIGMTIVVRRCLASSFARWRCSSSSPGSAARPTALSAQTPSRPIRRTDGVGPPLDCHARGRFHRAQGHRLSGRRSIDAGSPPFASGEVYQYDQATEDLYRRFLAAWIERPVLPVRECAAPALPQALA